MLYNNNTFPKAGNRKTNMREEKNSSRLNQTDTKYLYVCFDCLQLPP